MRDQRLAAPSRSDAIVVEHSDTVKTFLVQWNGVKVDLTKLARLRRIEKMKTPELCGVFGKRRSAIRQSIRTLRNSGLSGLNLTKVEKNIIKTQMLREEKELKPKREEHMRLLPPGENTDNAQFRPHFGLIATF